MGERLPTQVEVGAWFANRQDAICVVAGAVSGNLECLDFDNKGELFAAWMGRVNTGLLGRLVVEQTPSGGYHVLYRTDKPVDGNLKLVRGTRGGKLFGNVASLGVEVTGNRNNTQKAVVRGSPAHHAETQEISPCRA